MVFQRVGYVCLVVALHASAAGVALGQNEAALRQAFEGKDVIVKLDMPADTSGVEIVSGRDSSVDYRKIGNGLKKYGTAIRKGETVTITKVHVKNKLIEVQLAGGGYGTFADKMREPSAPVAFIDKTSREKDLERYLKSEPDSRRRRQMESELGDLRSRRESDQAQLRMEAAQLENEQKPMIDEQRLRSGSRFNIRFPGAVPSEMATPEAVISMLSPYVSFDATPQQEVAENVPQATATPSGSTLSLRKGMSEIEVSSLFGKPLKRDAKDVAGMNVVDATYVSPDATVAAQFVDGVLTKYTITGR